MAKRVQLIRHTSGSADLFVGLEGEITIDLTNDQVRVHDGVTAGGVRQARQDLSTTQAATSGNDGKMTSTLVALIESLDALTITHDTRLTTLETTYIPSGTNMLFFQAAAPVGWTQFTGYNDVAMRVVNGVGGGLIGNTPYSAIFSATTNTGATAITESQMPVHTHTSTFAVAAAGTHFHDSIVLPGAEADNPNFGSGSVIVHTTAGLAVTFSANAHTSTDGDHVHAITGGINNTGGNLGHTHTLTLTPHTIAVIICTKN